MFTTFVKGFTNKTQAINYLKVNKTADKKLFLLDVVIPRKANL